MNSPIQIKALNEHEAARLTATAQFNALRPVRCKSCGHTCNFERRVFWIGGVPKAEQTSERTQALIAAHLKERTGVGSIFFKSYRQAFYVDCALCKHCSSTDIEFDIELSDEVLAEVARRVGKPIAEVRNEIAALAGKIAGHDRKA